MNPRFVAVASLLLVGTASAAPKPGWIGLSMSTDTNSLMKVDSATVDRVTKGSPAERAGIAEGDQIVAVENCAIPGCAAPKARSLMEPPAGATVHLKLKRSSGEEYSAAVVAEAMPKGR